MLTEPTNLRYTEDSDLLLLEISPVLLIYQHQVQIVPCAELLVHITECWRKLESTKEQPDRYCFASYRRTIHDLELCNGFGFVVLVWWCACRFSTDNREFHVFDLDSDQEEVDFAYYNIFEVVSEFNMK